MHERFVEVQKPWADLVIDHSVTQSELGRLVATIRALRAGPDQDPTPLESAGSRVTTSPVAALQSL
jgi:hypothetical protein